MTIEERAKAYDEALERAKTVDCKTSPFIRSQLEYIFPELKESEDAKIKKELIEFVNSFRVGTLNKSEVNKYNSWISWIEKQGEKKYTEEELQKAYMTADEVMYRRGYEDAKRELEMQGEKKSNICEGCNNIKGCVTCTNGDQWAHITETSTVEVSYDEELIDKIQPKFKIGDWIVWYNCIYQVLDNNLTYVVIDTKGLESRYEHSTIDNVARYWTIQDAKDGDVLVDGNFVGLFKENNYNSSDESGCTYFYCSFDMDNNKFYTESGGYNPTYLYPAIKEQCNLLFSKMKEAGYEWNAKKKELRKLTQSEVIKTSEQWSEEDEKILSLMQKIVRDSDVSAKKANELSDWLKSLKDRFN